MTATAKFLAHALVVSTTLSASLVLAGPHDVALRHTVVLAASGQLNLTGDPKRKEAEDLLKQAREALSQGNVQLAEWHVGRAEKLGVQWRTLFSPWGDTPEAVRRDIAAAKNGQGAAGGTASPSGRFAPTEPSAAPPGASLPARVDPFSAGDPARAAIGALDDSKPKAQAALRSSRECLGRGDMLGAIHWYKEAAKRNATFAPNEDSPARLKAELEQAGVDPGALVVAPAAAPAPFAMRPDEPSGLADQIAAGNPAGAPAAEAALRGSVVENPYSLPAQPNLPRMAPPADPAAAPAAPAAVAAADRAEQGRTLLRDARKELARGNARGAQTLAAQCKALGVVFPIHADSPEKVQELVTASQRFAGGANVRTPADRKAFAEFLLRQADALSGYREFDAAEGLARQAAGLNAEFGQFERNPQMALQAIAQARTASGPNASAGNNPPSQPGAAAPQVGTANPWEAKRRETLKLLAEAQLALDRGQVELADQLTREAKALGVPDAAYAPNDLRPWMLETAVAKQLRQPRDANVRPVSGFAEEGPAGGRYPVARSVYDPGNDYTRTIPASGEAPTPAKLPPVDEQPSAPGAFPAPPPVVAAPLADPALPPAPGAAPGGAPAFDPAAQGAAPSEGHRLFRLGQTALQQFDSATAQQYFRQAWAFEKELDPQTRQQLKDYLQQVRPRPAPLAAPAESSAIDEVASRQQALLRGLMADIGREVQAAEKESAKEPKAALARLETLRQRVASSDLDAENRKRLLTRVDRSLESLKAYIDTNRPTIEQQEQNARVLEDVARSRKVTEETNQQLARMVDQFNTLMNQNRFAEAVVLAKQAQELDPDNPVTQNLVWKSRFAQQLAFNMSLSERKQQGFLDAMNGVEESAIAFDDRQPLVFPDARGWSELTQRRGRYGKDRQRRMSERELSIKRNLQTPVDVNFTNKPLMQVMDTLSQMADINVYLDPQGLAAEGCTVETPVTINLREPIKLESALNLILHPLRLSYVIQDDVLRITSEQTKDSDVRPEVYPVGDLVIPIPNFVPSYNIGLPAAIKAAHESMGYGMVGGRVYDAPLAIVAGNDGVGGTPGNASVLAQMASTGMHTPGRPSRMPGGHGPGGLGGGPQADFDTLIELITTTIAPTTWDSVGGAGSIAGFDTNLSLVVSQTQEVHDQIVDLLEQLRRLQDLQVTIEVRFIDITDNFFERIGVNFNFNVDSNVTAAQAQAAGGNDGSSVTIGLSTAADGVTPTADLDLQFRQGSFGATAPTIGGFDVNTAANFGFAILSDIEAFFVIQAAQGDTRSNIMQAPKVTLFNGQQAFVSDTTQVPFVTSVIPVVGDFAAAHQPVIVVLNEGTSLSVQAVVSNDKRFVRLTLVPFFSRIGDVQEFTFNGKKTTKSGTVNIDPSDNKQTVVDNAEEITEGTTIQLPQFSFVTVTTTVSVPDGGTVLLGGIKRLTEQRTERGVPVLSKIPYVNRLFKNVGIARTARSLMMMVTPRIIIQEEEEEKLGISGFGRS